MYKYMNVQLVRRYDCRTIYNRWTWRNKNGHVRWEVDRHHSTNTR